MVAGTALALFAVPLTSAWAAPAAEPIRNDEGARVVDDGEMRGIIFDEDDDVDGDLPRPAGDRISARHSAKHPSLIKLRVRFNDHLVRLSHDI